MLMSKTTSSKFTAKQFLVILIVSIVLALSMGAVVGRTFFANQDDSTEKAISAVVKSHDTEAISVEDIEYVDAFARGKIIGSDNNSRGMFIVKFENGHWTYVITSLDGIGKTTGESLGLPSEFYSDSDEY